ncbi:MAG: TAT-variant-translocated molybdopterin oxidoreductase, partial [Candidatus Eisenbacteria bacterium]|nr:TAT-variant-translocated molybdopterin oxidoreductase [Candidatus Eisenbacteria bacterium]
MKAPLQLKTDPRRYWRSMDELQDGPEFKKFLAEEYPDVTPPDEMGRRKFMGVMGAAFAMAGLVGCRRPLAKILPYSKMPEQLVPGIAQQYATAWDFRGAAQGLLVTAYEGRPTKIEGNPDQPQNNGATDSYAQASILSLYDPDRSQKVMKDGAESTWREFRLWAETHFEGLRAQNGRGLHVVSEVTSSPMLIQIREDFVRTYPGATWHTFEPVNRDQSIEGTRLAFGRPLRTHVDFGQADVIVALDSDFLLDEVNTLRQARDFANGRRVADPSDKMNRLYAVESRFTTTGSMADHRLRMASGRIRAYVAGIAMKLASSHGVSLAGIDLAGLRRIAGGSTWNERETQWMDAVAKDLAQNRGRCVVVAGESQPAAVHAFLHALNRALGNVGPVVRYTEEPDPGAHSQSLNRLAQSLDAGQVDTLVVLGANPAYAAPGALGMADKLKKAKNSVHLGLYRDETGALAQWHVPGTHYLETWGDARAWDGTLSLSQPLIAPLFDGKSESELLALLAEGTETDGHTQVQDFYRSAWGASRFDASWNRALHDGVVANTQYSEVVESPSGSAISVALRQLAAVTAPSANALEVVLHPDVKLYDGRFANNAWLQELPDPMTKLTWDNVALMSPQTARDLGVESGDMVSLAAGAGTLELPVWVQPGQADQSVAISLGYGRTQCGRVGDNVGVNAYSLLDASGETVLAGGKITPTGLKYKLATTQNHSSMENRPLYREATLDEFKKHPDFVDHMEESPPLKSLFVDTNTSILDREYDFKEGNQWGMAIDLN